MIYNSIVLTPEESMMEVQCNDELKQPAQPRLRWVLMLVASVGGAIPFGLGCKKAPVPVKLDTPEATASTVLHLYAAKQIEGLKQVVDPALVPVEVRQKACGEVILQWSRCTEELMRARLEGNSPSRGCMEAASPRDCTCGERGAKAVAEAGGYLDTNAHGVLRDADLDADRCTVTNIQALDKASVSKAVPSFSNSVCEDASASDSYTSAEIKCGDQPSIVLVLRASDGKWRLFALEQQTIMRWVLSRPR